MAQASIRTAAHAAAMALASALAFAGAAHAQTSIPALFRAPTPADVSAAKADAGPKNPATAREGLLALDADVAGALDKTDAVKIALFPNAAATFRRVGTEEAYGGGSIWEGEAGTSGTATLVVQNGKVTGHVALRGRSYEIVGVGGAAHRVIEIAASKLPPEGPIMVPKELQRGKDDGVATPDEVEAAKDGKTTTVNVNIGFTSAASGNESGDANLAVSLANKAYKASGVKIKMKIAAIGVVPGYNEQDTTSGWGAMLDAMTYTDRPGSAAFNATRQAREDFKADLVTIIRSGTLYCGLGWYVVKPSGGNSGLAYSEVARNCITNYSVAHEMGHNMGLDHDRYVAGNASNKKYNFGFVNAKKRIRSIMAYDNQCQDKGFSCQRLNHFSDPKDKIEGDKFGIKKGDKGAADAARRLNETREAIAKYR